MHNALAKVLFSFLFIVALMALPKFLEWALDREVDMEEEVEITEDITVTETVTS
jgi:hypothetical protein